jgi:hypothetical protein
MRNGNTEKAGGWLPDAAVVVMSWGCDSPPHGQKKRNSQVQMSTKPRGGKPNEHQKGNMVTALIFSFILISVIFFIHFISFSPVSFTSLFFLDFLLVLSSSAFFVHRVPARGCVGRGCETWPGSPPSPGGRRPAN